MVSLKQCSRSELKANEPVLAKTAVSTQPLSQPLDLKYQPPSPVKAKFLLGLKYRQTLIQRKPAIKFDPRPLRDLRPHRLECLVTVHIVARGRLRTLDVPNRCAKNHATALRLEQRDAVLEQGPLLLQPENVKHHPQVQKINLTLELGKSAVSGENQGVCFHEVRRQPVVAEELVAEADERRVQLGTVEVLRRCAVHDELADVLAQTAADVEVLGPLLDAADYGGV